MSDLKPEEAGHTVSVHGLTKRFGFNRVLEGIDLTLRQGEFLTIFGPNGAGKTTLLRILSTLVRPSAGKIILLGYDLEKEGETLRRHIGVLTHQTFLFDNLTAYENLRFYGRMFGVKQLNRRISQLLADVGLIDHRSQQVGTFSRGMQQRLAIARAVIHEPHLLLLDEPHTGLDQSGMDFLRKTLKAFLQGGRTVIMSCHDFALGLELCNKAAVLNRGHLTFYGTPSEVNHSFDSFYRRCLGVEGRM